MNWSEISELCFGRLINGRLDCNAVRADFFIEPYNQGVKLLKDGKDNIELIIGKIGIQAYQAAMREADNRSMDKLNMIQLLETAYYKEKVATNLERISRNLRKGEDVDVAKITSELEVLDGNIHYLTPLSEIVPDPDPFLPSGWDAIDEHLIGLPKSGLVTWGGTAGSGKTSGAIKLMTKFLEKYPNKLGLFFTLEMPKAEFKQRVLDIHSVPIEVQKRFLVEDLVTGVEDVAAKAHTFKNESGIVMVDFADLLVQDLNSEPEMANIYRTLAVLAKRMEIPVILLSQLNRNYVSGSPRPTHLRYTSLAEALSWAIFMTYNPNSDFHTKDMNNLPTVDGAGYLIVWKYRGGFRLHPQKNPGAIVLGWDGRTAWSDCSRGIGDNGEGEHWVTVK